MNINLLKTAEDRCSGYRAWYLNFSLCLTCVGGRWVLSDDDHKEEIPRDFAKAVLKHFYFNWMKVTAS